MENNSTLLENYVLVSSIEKESNDKKVKIPNAVYSLVMNNKKIDNDDYISVNKDNFNWDNHSINVIIDSKFLLRDLRKHLRSLEVVKKNFEIDMPRSKFFINKKRIVNPNKAIEIISKYPNYKDILRLSTASVLGFPYEVIFSSYNGLKKIDDDNILHLNDSIPKSMIVNVNLFEDNSSEINVIKILQLTKIEDNQIPLGIITLKLSFKLNKSKKKINQVVIVH